MRGKGEILFSCGRFFAVVEKIDGSHLHPLDNLPEILYNGNNFRWKGS